MRSFVVLLVIISALTFAVGLNRPAITDSDEAYYAEAGREMVSSGDWLTPHFNYEPRFQKPVLFYWFVAGCYWFGGVSEFGARLGSALAGLGLVLIAFAAGRRWFNESTGALAGAIVATSFGCVALARSSLPDLPLAFFITLAAWAAFVALFDRQRRARRWWLLAGVAAGLAFLTKGPVGVAIPALVLAPPFLLERGWRRVKWLDLVLAGVAFVVVATPWYVAMWTVHGNQYLTGFFVGDNLERFATSRFNDPRPFYYYGPIVLAGMLPWSPFFVLSVKPLWRAARRQERLSALDIRILGWALLPLLLFTASIGKQPRYIMPALVPLALWLAVSIERATKTLVPLPAAQPRLFRILTVTSGVLIGVLAVLLYRVRPLLVEIPAIRVTTALVALGVTAVAVTALAMSRQWRRGSVAIASAGIVLVLALQYAVLDVPGLDPVERMANEVLQQRRAGEPVAPYRAFVRNLIFYTHIEQTDLYSDEANLREYLSRPDRVLCVITENELKPLEASGQIPLKRLASVTYFDAPTAKPRALLWPDPERDLRTVVLVANR